MSTKQTVHPTKLFVLNCLNGTLKKKIQLVNMNDERQIHVINIIFTINEKI